MLLSASLNAASAQLDATKPSCNFGEAVESGDGKLRLAMIVGINEYKNIPSPLEGAVADATKIYDLLVGDQKNVFPRENVCVLTNEEATYQGFKTAFQKAIVDRAQGADEVVIYYAGHGSQLVDRNNDDGDGWDETLFLYDSSKRERPNEGLKYNQLLDDEFNGMLAALKEKTENFTVILDSCHSGSATRDVSGEEMTRFVEPDEEEVARSSAVSEEAPGVVDGSFGFSTFTPATFPNAVMLAAARDDERAIERGGAGLFTSALVSALRADPRITYRQLTARINAELGAEGRQTSVVSGASQKLVFSKDIPYRPRFDWMVVKASGDSALIRGLPTIGMGEGAEFLILPGSMTEAQAKDPKISKARMKAVAQEGTNEWRLELIESFGRGVIKEGDFAALALPSASARRLHVRIRPSAEAGGIVNQESLRADIVERLDSVLKPGDIPLIEFVSSGRFDLEIMRNSEGRLQLTDPDGILRNAYDDHETDDLKSLARDLSNHFQQIVLLREWKIAGGSLVPNQSLQVRLEPKIDKQYNICKTQHQGIGWPGKANTPQRIPLCASYKIFVKLDKDASVPLIVAGSVMSADGSMVRTTRERRRIDLKPGDEESFDMIFQATPESYGKPEYIFVIGLPAKPTAGESAYEIPWHLLSTADERTRASPVGSDERPQREFGTYTILPIKTVANPEFGEETSEGLNPNVITREYTISNFDIAPYLPDDKNSALFRVLKVAEELANYEGSGDGISYNQHLWCKGSTKANLKEGIDCSRSIWYAFTRASLPYNQYATSVPDEAQCVDPYDPAKDGYLYSGDMARKDYLMNDQFVECSAANESGERSFKLGDVLVYRDKEKGDGHVVMVIDPEERIAWGSHGWDGNPRLLKSDSGEAPDPDLGVEFQKIKFKADWNRWDRPTMQLAACWRHKEFIREAKSGKGRPGFSALCEAIDLENRFVRGSLCWKLLH